MTAATTYTRTDLDAACFAREVAQWQEQYHSTEEWALEQANAYIEEPRAACLDRLAAGKRVLETAQIVASPRAVQGTAGEEAARVALTDRHMLLTDAYRISAGFIAGSPAVRWTALAAR